MKEIYAIVSKRPGSRGQKGDPRNGKENEGEENRQEARQERQVLVP